MAQKGEVVTRTAIVVVVLHLAQNVFDLAFEPEIAGLWAQRASDDAVKPTQRTQQLLGRVARLPQQLGDHLVTLDECLVTLVRMETEARVEPFLFVARVHAQQLEPAEQRQHNRKRQQQRRDQQQGKQL
eukprot:6214399-Pleurochrysis_carterae.AAC.2